MQTIDSVSFPGAQGQELVGRLHRPTGPIRAYALFAHCFTCGKDLKVAARIATGLALDGIATLRFDFPGLGQSGGNFADSTFGTSLDDLLAAADYLRREHQAPQILVGHSLGGAAVLGVARQVEEGLLSMEALESEIGLAEEE